jgi:hypothetical protein
MDALIRALGTLWSRLSEAVHYLAPRLPEAAQTLGITGSSAALGSLSHGATHDWFVAIATAAASCIGGWWIHGLLPSSVLQGDRRKARRVHYAVKSAGALALSVVVHADSICPEKTCQLGELILRLLWHPEPSTLANVAATCFFIVALDLLVVSLDRN